MIRKIFQFLTIFSVVLSLLTFFAPPVSANMTYGSGEYINLCGSGTAATFNSCGGHCNTNTGSCSYPSTTVVKYTCDGREPDCRSNESNFSTYQSVSGTSCGKTVQIDVFSKKCRESNGSWSCGDGDLKDYIVWYSGDCGSTTPNPTPTPTNTCKNYEPINTQFRETGENTWVSGNDITNRKLEIGDQVDANCFAKNGTTLLPGARIRITHPDNVVETKNTAELRRYQITKTGSYGFRCESTTLADCRDSDSFRVSTTTVIDDHESVCENLTLVSGNAQTVPATAKFSVKGKDNKGDIQRYRVYFGNGARTENETGEFTHTYDVSGNFTARADIKDSKGRWVTSSACETKVEVKPRNIESHKSDCSDLFILKGNHQQAPSSVELKVTGYDNKGALQKYRVDFGNGVVKENDGQVFEQVYPGPGTYTLKGYVQDSNGDWKGGDESCRTTLYIETAPITKQPDTGTATGLTIFGITTGVIGIVALFQRRALLKA